MCDGREVFEKDGFKKGMGGEKKTPENWKRFQFVA